MGCHPSLQCVRGPGVPLVLHNTTHYSFQGDPKFLLNPIKNKKHFSLKLLLRFQQRVKSCLAENARDRQLQRLSRGPSEGRKIRVAIPSDDVNTGILMPNGNYDSDKISAAILAKVLEERDKERQGDR